MRPIAPACKCDLSAVTARAFNEQESKSFGTFPPLDRLWSYSLICFLASVPVLTPLHQPILLRLTASHYASLTFNSRHAPNTRVLVCVPPFSLEPHQDIASRSKFLPDRSKCRNQISH